MAAEGFASVFEYPSVYLGNTSNSFGVYPDVLSSVYVQRLLKQAIRCDGAGSARGNVVLQLENVFELHFKPLRPKMRTGRSLYELPGNAYTLAGLVQAAAIEHVIDA